MKKQLLFLLSFILILGCEKEDSPSKVDAISVSSNSLKFEEGVGNQSITINSSDNWKLLGNSDWCRPSKTTGKSGDTIEFTTTINSTTSERYQFFILICGDKELTIVVLQNPKNKFLSVSKTSISLDRLDQVFDFLINSDTEYDVLVNSSWIIKESNNNNNPKFKVTENTGSSDRIGEVRVVSKDSKINLTVIVNQKNSYGRYSDSLALMSLSNQIEENIRPNGWGKKPITEWEFIKTEMINGELRVVRLNNSFTGLQSERVLSLTTEMKYLSELRELELFNVVKGEALQNIKSLKKLSRISLVGNKLTIENLNDIGDLINLNYIQLVSPGIKGIIPSRIFDLKNITFLHLKSINLVGGIPSQIKNLNKLYNFQISSPGIIGFLPKELFEMTSLGVIGVFGTNITGSIPKEIGNLKNLILINFSDNKLFGEIPKETKNLSKLAYLLLGNNNLTGEVPLEIGNLPLNEFNIANNNFSGALPSTFKNNPNWLKWDPLKNIFPQKPSYGFSNVGL